MDKKIKISETIELEPDLKLAYDTIKMSYEYYRTKEGLNYSFNEYLLRCGLSALLTAFEREQKGTKIFEGHA